LQTVVQLAGLRRPAATVDFLEKPLDPDSGRN
jgi:hypothetical protein